MIINKITNNSVEGFQIFDEEGNEYFITEETEQLAIAKYTAIKEREANPPGPSVEEKRKAEYLEKGLTPEKLIIALWEDMVEGRPEEVNRIQAERLAVKQKYPKT